MLLISNMPLQHYNFTVSTYVPSHTNWNVILWLPNGFPVRNVETLALRSRAICRGMSPCINFASSLNPRGITKQYQQFSLSTKHTYIFLVLINKNYYVVRNAGWARSKTLEISSHILTRTTNVVRNARCACSRYTLNFFKFFKIN